MPPYYPPTTEQDTLVTSALRVIEADHYSNPADPHADAEREYAAEKLALAARDLTLAVSTRHPDGQPIGWRTDPGKARHVYLDTEFMRADLTQSGLVSIALTDDQDNDYYAVNWDLDETAVRDDPWMRENVWPYLPRWFTDIKGLISATGVDPGSIPEQPANAHHPLDDAQHNRFVRHYLAAL